MSVRDWATIRRSLIDGDTYNAEVTSHFGDTSSDPNRDAVKQLCLVKSTDSALIAQQRIRFFREQVQKVQNKPIIIGQPKSNLDADVKYHPEISVYLIQDSQSLTQGASPIDARFSWRLMDQTSESITNDILNNWANKIYNAFFNPVFSFAKGKYIGWYISPKDGLHLQLYCLDEATTESVARKIVSSIGKDFSDDLFKITKPKKDNLQQSQATISILGQTKKVPQWRPTANVFAKQAYINIWNDDVHLLVDKIGVKFYPILR